jgi:tripartite-type tricarboxylate transporter receptor subunit TctC
LLPPPSIRIKGEDRHVSASKKFTPGPGVPLKAGTGAITRRGVSFGLLTAGAAALTPSAWISEALAQEFPSRPITLIVPVAPGGPTDIVARAAAQRMQAAFKQNVVVENRTGAAGNIGAQAAAKAEPNGYTLGVLFAPLAQNTAIYRAPGYDLLRDFKPVVQLGGIQLIVIGRKGLPFKTLPEMIDYARANPEKLSCGSVSPPQSEYLHATLKAKIAILPYRGAAQILTDVVGGQIDLGLLPFPNALPHIQAGNIHAVLTTAAKRIHKLPDVMAVAELFPGFSITSWYGLAAPAGIPDGPYNRLRDVLIDITGSPDFKQFLEERNFEIPEDPAAFDRVIQSEVALWRRLQKELNLPQI